MTSLKSAARALLALSSGLPEEQRWHRMAARLDTLERDPTRRAWALRRMLDDAYRDDAALLNEALTWCCPC